MVWWMKEESTQNANKQNTKNSTKRLKKCTENKKIGGCMENNCMQNTIYSMYTRKFRNSWKDVKNHQQQFWKLPREKESVVGIEARLKRGKEYVETLFKYNRSNLLTKSDDAEELILKSNLFWKSDGNFFADTEWAGLISNDLIELQSSNCWVLNVFNFFCLSLLPRKHLFLKTYISWTKVDVNWQAA